MKVEAFPDDLRIGAFAAEFGECRRSAESIEGFPDICAAKGLRNFRILGCDSFLQMTGPLESYIGRCLATTLATSGVSAADVGHLVLSTADANLQHIDFELKGRILRNAGLANCITTMISMQECVASLGALAYGCQVFQDPAVRHVLVVAFDFERKDQDRIKPFALYSDAVSSFMISRDSGSGLSLTSYAANLDFAGLAGQDSFDSRKRVAETTMAQALAPSGTRLRDVEKCFLTNLYKPLALFNASICGIKRGQMYIETLNSHGHCGNCDWMINLLHYEQHVGFTPGKKYLVQSSAPGFFASGLLRSVA